MGQRNHDPGEGVKGRSEVVLSGKLHACSVGPRLHRVPPVEEEGGAQGPNRADVDRTESVHLSR